MLRHLAARLGPSFGLVFVVAAAGCAGDPPASVAASARESSGAPGVHSHDRLPEHSHNVLFAQSRDAIPFHRPAGTGKAYFGPGDLYTFLVTGEESDGAYFQFEAIVPPGGGPPPHIHGGEDESFYLAEGTLEMLLGDKTVIVRAGDFVNVPRGTAHRFINVSDKSAKLIITFVPAGMEKFFTSVFPEAHDRNAPPPAMTDEVLRKLIEQAPKHRMTLLPAPATQPAG